MYWWVPQIVSAICWCHEQGYAHRDIKPHNFVLTDSARVLLIDFGSAAPLLPPRSDGSRALQKRVCLAPCGTCDYISPEILRFHEDALVALEMEEEDISDKSLDEEGYGLETDWWSLGAMLYELVYGVAPFFAEDIRQTYTRILAHDASFLTVLSRMQTVNMSFGYRHVFDSIRASRYMNRFTTCWRSKPPSSLITLGHDRSSRLLTDADHRLGRHGVEEIFNHPYFRDIPLDSLTTRNCFMFVLIVSLITWLSQDLSQTPCISLDSSMLKDQ